MLIRFFLAAINNDFLKKAFLFFFVIEDDYCAYLIRGSNAVEVSVDEDADAVTQLLSLLHQMR